jgi:hypothetical protein
VVDVDGEDRSVAERRPHPGARHQLREWMREGARDGPIRERGRSCGIATVGTWQQVLIRLMFWESKAPTCRPWRPQGRRDYSRRSGRI